MSHWRRRYTREPYGQREAGAALLGFLMCTALGLALMALGAMIFVWPFQ